MTCGATIYLLIVLLLNTLEIMASNVAQTCASAILIGVLLKLNFLNLSYFTKLVQTYFKRFIVKGSAQIKHFGWTENVH